MPPHFYEPATGDLLHHYASPSGALGIVRSGRLWLSDFARMNDATEYHYAREAYLRSYHARQVWIDDVPRYAATLALVGLEQNTNMLIGCFCGESDNQHLWQHYAADGGGCVLSFDASHMVTQLGVTIRRVVYDANDINDFVQAGLSMLQDQFEADPDDRAQLTELARLFVSDLYAFKAPEWSAEREIRVSRMLVRDATVLEGVIDVGGHTADGEAVAACPVKIRDGAFGQTAYIELPIEGALKAITLGPRMEPELVAQFEALEAVKSGRVELRRTSAKPKSRGLSSVWNSMVRRVSSTRLFRWATRC